MNTIKTSTRGTCMKALLLSLLAMGIAGACYAADDIDALQATVKYGDLNPSTPEGAAALYSRIHAAAQSVCRPFEGREPEAQGRFEACVHQAITAAVAKIDRPSLVAFYQLRNKSPAPIVLAAGPSR